MASFHLALTYSALLLSWSYVGRGCWMRNHGWPNVNDITFLYRSSGGKLGAGVRVMEACTITPIDSFSLWSYLLRAVLLLIFLRIYILVHFILLSSWFNFKLTYIGISTYSCTQLRTRQVYTKMCYITDKYTWCFNASIKYEGKFSNWKLLVYHGVDEA